MSEDERDGVEPTPRDVAAAPGQRDTATLPTPRDTATLPTPRDTAALPAPGDIATLPAPPPADRAGYPVSAHTGLPRRPGWLVVTCAVFAVHIAGVVWCFASFWWLAASVTRLPQSNRLFGWLTPDPVSFLTVALVLLTAAIAIGAVGAWGAVMFNAWQGRRGVRWGVLAGLAASGLTVWLQTDVLSFGLFRYLPGFAHALVWPTAWAGAGVTVAAAVTLWLPPFRRFCQAMTPAPRPQDLRPVDLGPVVYGPQRLIGN